MGNAGAFLSTEFETSHRLSVLTLLHPQGAVRDAVSEKVSKKVKIYDQLTNGEKLILEQTVSSVIQVVSILISLLVRCQDHESRA